METKNKNHPSPEMHEGIADGAEPAVKVYPISARMGLAARMSGDAALYKQSGLKALEEALACLLPFFPRRSRPPSWLQWLTKRCGYCMTRREKALSMKVFCKPARGSCRKADLSRCNIIRMQLQRR